MATLIQGACTSTPLSEDATYTSGTQAATPYSSLIVATLTDAAGTLYVDFSPDGVNWDSTYTNTIVGGTDEVHRMVVERPWFRVRLVNGGSAQSYLRLTTMGDDFNIRTVGLESELTGDEDAMTVRAIQYGKSDGGVYLPVPVTSEGHLEIAVHEPRLPFGSIHTERLNPAFQTTATYGLNTATTLSTINASGTVAVADSAFVCTPGTTIYGAGSLQSRRRLTYRPGQGIVGRFTASYSARVANSYAVVGMGHPEDGIYLGYSPNSSEWGILYTRHGAREIRTLTVTTASSHSENAVVTLNSVAFNIAVTNSGNATQTAWELAQGTYTGWKAEQVGTTVIFVSDSVGAKNGTYSITGTSVAGTFAQNKAGAAVTESFVPQSSFNLDTLDGNGPSGLVLDPTKLNVFQLGIQYLGAGALTFQIEHALAGNNPTWVTFHNIVLPNTLTIPSFGNPSFPFTMSAYSYGSTTDFSVKCASFGGFTEGDRYFTGQRVSYYGQKSSVDAAAYYPLFTVRNSRSYGGRANQTVIHAITITGALKHNNPCTLYVFRNATLAGTPSFTTAGTGSCAYYDTAATTCTISDNNQLVASFSLGDTGNFEFNFETDISIQPGETLTVAAKTAFGSASYVIASLNTEEDH